MPTIASGFRLANNVKIPCVGLGTWQVPDDEKLIEHIHDAINIGYRHFDTAFIYGNEAGVGEAVRTCGIPREKLFITSKLWNADRGYDAAMRAFDNTLQKMDLSYLDLFLIHWPLPFPGADWKPLVTESWRALERLYDEGAVRAIGVCNFLPQHLLHVLKTANTAPMIDQFEFHPGYPQYETLQFCQSRGIQAEAWSPLGRGRLLEDPLVLELAKKYGKSPAQICLRFCLQNNVLPLPKSSAPQRMKANLDIFDFEIEQEDIYRLLTMPQTGWSGLHPEHFE